MSTKEQLRNYISGEWRRSTASEHLEITNPATAERLAQVPLGGEDDVAAAVQELERQFLLRRARAGARRRRVPYRKESRDRALAKGVVAQVLVEQDGILFKQDADCSVLWGNKMPSCSTLIHP